MNKKILKKLVELDIYKEEMLDKDEYDELCSKQDKANIIVLENNKDKWYKVVNTKEFTEEEIRLMLEVDRTISNREMTRIMKYFYTCAIISAVSSLIMLVLTII